MRLFELTEGRYDPHTHKAIFMLGGPGSGKTHVSKKLIGGTGLRTVNVDEFYEMLRDRKGIQGKGFDDELYKYSGNLTQKKLDLLLKGRIGLLVDGTGRKVQRLAQMKDELESLGYDTMAVFVNTDINTALDRNEERRRKADSQWVRKVHADLQQKLGDLQTMFGRNMLIVDNTNDRKDFSDAQKTIDQFLNMPNKRPVSWPVTEAFGDDEQEVADVYKTVAYSMMRRAKDYIDKGGKPLQLAYRGYEKHSIEPFHRPFRENRNPKDSSNELSKMFELAIDSRGGIASRSNSIFVQGNAGIAGIYGEIYVVFPIGKFHYTWSEHFSDWYDELGEKYGLQDGRWTEFVEAVGWQHPIENAREIIRKADKERQRDMEPGDKLRGARGEEISQVERLAFAADIFLELADSLVVNQGLPDALSREVEVMISAEGGYYYIPEYYFFKYVAPYFELEGIPVEPRQRGHLPKTGKKT